MPSKPTTQKRLDELRAQLATARQKQEELPQQRLPRWDALERAHAWVDGQAELMRAGYRVHCFADAERPTARDLLCIDAAHHQGQGFGTADAGPLLCWLFGDAIKAKIGEALESMPEDGGLPFAERRAELKRLDEEIRELEIAEEQLVRASEQTDEPAERRADADPEIVLATDAALRGETTTAEAA